MATVLARHAVVGAGRSVGTAAAACRGGWPTAAGGGADRLGGVRGSGPDLALAARPDPAPSRVRRRLPEPSAWRPRLTASPAGGRGSIPTWTAGPAHPCRADGPAASGSCDRQERPHGYAIMPPAGRRPTLGPAVGVLREPRALHADGAEPLARGRLNHHPAVQAVHHHRAQLLQAHHLGRNVIGLDVDVDAALLLHVLDLHDGLVWWRRQHAVVAAAGRMLQVHRAAQRLAPEPGVHVGSPAVDQHGAEAGVVYPKCQSCKPVEPGTG